MTIQVPKSVVDALGFDLLEEAEKHAKAVRDHMMGEPGIPAPQPRHPLVGDLIQRIPQSGPVAKRGPDEIAVADFEIYDDTPPEEIDPAIKLLRETIN